MCINCLFNRSINFFCLIIKQLKELVKIYFTSINRLINFVHEKKWIKRK
ncbi:MAG: hypothetical protein JWP44_681 [Mucilaginibacter sp.]|nr:hypothetical protein [Mucilaginibacter sp.]